MALVTGYSRGTWDEGAYGQPLPVVVTGESLTASLGDETVSTGVLIIPTGEEATSALGSVTVTTEAIISVTGLQGTFSIGEFYILEGYGVTEALTGNSMTASLGTVIVWDIIDAVTATWSAVSGVSTTWTEVSTPTATWTDVAT